MEIQESGDDVGCPTLLLACGPWCHSQSSVCILSAGYADAPFLGGELDFLGGSETPQHQPAPPAPLSHSPGDPCVSHLLLQLHQGHIIVVEFRDPLCRPPPDIKVLMEVPPLDGNLLTPCCRPPKMGIRRSPNGSGEVLDFGVPVGWGGSGIRMRESPLLGPYPARRSSHGGFHPPGSSGQPSAPSGPPEGSLHNAAALQSGKVMGKGMQEHGSALESPVPTGSSHPQRTPLPPMILHDFPPIPKGSQQSVMDPPNPGHSPVHSPHPYWIPQSPMVPPSILNESPINIPLTPNIPQRIPHPRWYPKHSPPSSIAPSGSSPTQTDPPQCPPSVQRATVVGQCQQG